MEVLRICGIFATASAADLAATRSPARRELRWVEAPKNSSGWPSCPRILGAVHGSETPIVEHDPGSGMKLNVIALTRPDEDFLLLPRFLLWFCLPPSGLGSYRSLDETDRTAGICRVCSRSRSGEANLCASKAELKDLLRPVDFSGFPTYHRRHMQWHRIGGSMNFYKVTVTVDGRDLESVVKEGVVATIEAGKRDNGVNQPQMRISIIAGQKANEPSAWIQVSRPSGAGTFLISHEGWINGEDNKLGSVASDAPTKATVERVERVDDLPRKLLEGAEFGSFDCCTAYGNGCYVTCCNGCCADPVGCPGANCCA